MAALVALADVGSHRDRADAGRALVSFADQPDARGPPLRLLLDAEDTLVARALALRECAEPAREAGTTERDGPARLAAALADLDPVLWPVDRRDTP